GDIGKAPCEAVAALSPWLCVFMESPLITMGPNQVGEANTHHAIASASLASQIPIGPESQNSFLMRAHVQICSLFLCFGIESWDILLKNVFLLSPTIDPKSFQG
ncbi:hypothetical protein AMTR_s00061p00180900, partial [Amborella trichopoda]